MKKTSKAKKRPPPPSHRPGPFHSKYSRHALEILQWRRDGATWKQVVEALAKLDVTADEGGVCRFIKRFQATPYGIGQHPEPLQAALPFTDARQRASASTPEKKESLSEKKRREDEKARNHQTKTGFDEPHIY